MIYISVLVLNLSLECTLGASPSLMSTDFNFYSVYGFCNVLKDLMWFACFITVFLLYV